MESHFKHDSVILNSKESFFLKSLCFISPLLSCLSPHAMIWPLILGGGFASIKTRKNYFTFIRQSDFFFILFLLWGLLSCFWSKSPFDSIALVLRLTLLCLAGFSWVYFLQQLSQKEEFLQFFFYGFIFALTFLIMDYLLGNLWQIFCNKTAAKAFAQGSLFLSMGVWICLHRYRMLWLFPLSISTFFLIESDTPFFALGLSFLILSIKKLITFRFVGKFFAFSVLITPWVAFYGFSPNNISFFNHYFRDVSYIHRLFIWHTTAEKILEKPFLGYGLDSSRLIGKEKITWSFTNKNAVQETLVTEAIPIHPHNGPLQWWLELGIIGALLGAWFIYKLYNIVDKYPSYQASGLMLTATAIAWINVGFWQNWWIASLWFLTGLISIRYTPPS